VGVGVKHAHDSDHAECFLGVQVFWGIKLQFVQKCFNCDNELVNFTIRYAVWHGRIKSPLGCSVFQCCSRYDVEYERFVIEPSVYSGLL